MDRLNEYTVLKDFLVANRDTLIPFRNALDAARPRTKEEKKRNIIRQPSDCFRFSGSNYDWELENIPAALQPAFDSLYKNVAVSGLNACQVCNHGEVEMYVKSVEGGKNIRLSHSLHWDGSNASPSGKDTLLGNCRYAIHLLVYGE